MKNYLKYLLWLILIVLFVLIGMYWLFVIMIDGYMMRCVDLLSDVCMFEFDKDEVVVDSLLLVLVVKFVFVDMCCSGMICIEDYSDLMM